MTNRCSSVIASLIYSFSVPPRSMQGTTAMTGSNTCTNKGSRGPAPHPQSRQERHVLRVKLQIIVSSYLAFHPKRVLTFYSSFLSDVWAVWRSLSSAGQYTSGLQLKSTYHIKDHSSIVTSAYSDTSRSDGRGEWR